MNCEMVSQAYSISIALQAHFENYYSCALLKLFIQPELGKVRHHLNAIE